MIKRIIIKHWSVILLISLMGAYIAYFSYFTILRYKTLYASYFDLGIMHQTVYNTYRAIATFDWSRVLELTNPFGAEQIKRMAIHNDVLLIFLAPFYFVHAGPETLLIIQTVILALGALAVYLISKTVFEKNKYKNPLSLIFSFAYLLYPAMERTNIYEFHAVALATTFLLFMFYFWLKNKYVMSFMFFILSILSKEQVALVTLFFGVYVLFKNYQARKRFLYPIAVIVISIFWFVVSMLLIIPFFRGDNHFALGYYSDLGRYIWHIDTLRYFFFLLGPLSFFSLLSPLHLVIALPEFGINLLSNSLHMRNIIFHYTAVIQPFVFISAIYGSYHVMNFVTKRENLRRSPVFVASIILVCTLLFAYFKGPLPYSREQEIHPFKYPQQEYRQVGYWQDLLKDEVLKVSSTGQLAPHFTSRRYFYNFSENYFLADYVVLRPNEIYNYPEKDVLIPVYLKLKKDPQFKLIHEKEGLEVYKKVSS